MASPQWIHLVALIAASAIIHLAQAQSQDQEGFISLDCGLPPSELSPYNEPLTGLWFTSDSNFIQTGKLGRIEKRFEEEYLTQHITLRYFPDGIRNCYNLTVKKGTNYLIRARNVYGNYDGLNINPKFDLYLGPNFWVTINMAKFAGNGTWEEIFHIPKSNSLDLCLVKTGTSTPFISAIELRPLPNNSYITASGSFKTFKRLYLSTSVDYQRYPDDVYDRMWDPYFTSSWKNISTSFKVNTSNSFLLPQVAVTTAATPTNTSAPLVVTINLEYPTDKVFVYLHLSELQALRANETRQFDILLSKESVREFYSPIYLQSNTLRNPFPISCENAICILKLSKSRQSTHPPLLNALEIFTVAELPQSDTDENDVEAIKKIKATYGLTRIAWQGDPCVPRAFLWDGLFCSDTNTSMIPRITSLNLSSSGLTGTIAAGIQNLTHLEKLDLSNNNLTGEVPEFLAHMKSLLLINLSKNNMKGAIPQALRDREKDGLKLFVGEGEMVNQCSSGSCGTKKKFPAMIVALAASAVVVIIVMILVLIFVFRKKKERSHVKATPSSPIASRDVTPTSISETSIETKSRKFTYSEVMEMTNNFEKALGEGGFGIVYHGYLKGSELVAIKVLSESSSQGYKHFKAEVELLLRVHHVNLVSLVGYCDERDHLALIYEYMSNGDLKYHLSGKHSGSVLSWSTRLRIAVDAALGLEYLHIGCRPTMVHRDVKSTNILLGEGFMAKIADFGLSRSCQLESQVSTVVAGTLGYLDPEYYKTGRLAEKSDVYSFGIVLLELITNQPVIDQNREKSHITEWVSFALNRGDITEIMDPNLDGDYNSISVWRALELAMLCAFPSSEKRPNMSQVVSELKECLISEDTMRLKNQDTDSHSSPDTTAVPSAR